MGFWDVAFLPSQYSFQPHFLKIVVEVKASGLPHILKLCLGVNMFDPTNLLCLSNFIVTTRL